MNANERKSGRRLFFAFFAFICGLLCFCCLFLPGHRPPRAAVEWLSRAGIGAAASAGRESGGNRFAGSALRLFDGQNVRPKNPAETASRVPPYGSFAACPQNVRPK
ncbi:MAG: hypothetical protein ACREP2_01010 [Rhodanobacteraceae bacterium]